MGDLPKNVKDDYIVGISLANICDVDLTRNYCKENVCGSRFPYVLLNNGDMFIVRTDSKINLGQKLYYCPDGKIWGIKEIKNRFLKRLGIACSTSDEDGYLKIKIVM